MVGSSSLFQIIEVSLELLAVLPMPANRFLQIAMFPEHGLVRVEAVELLEQLLLSDEACQERVLPHKGLPKGGESCL